MLLLAEAEKALDGRVAVRAVLPFALRAPGELSRLGRLGQGLAGAEQRFDVDAVVHGLIGICHWITP